LGNAVRCITLQNFKEGKNEARLFDVYLIRTDGTEERIDDPHQYGGWQDLSYELIMPRKSVVHTVDYDYLWAELNIFYDDIPLKLKNYKGIRLELEEPLNDFHVKIIGDEEQNVDYVGLNGTSTTIMFNTDIFRKEINRVTLLSDIDGKGEAKVISAWLIRQDGTEEFSDLSPYHGCEIIIKGDANTDGNVTKEDITALANLIMSDAYNANADMNNDGKVNAVDLVLLTNTINKK
jgi:hypothetical protein